MNLSYGIKFKLNSASLIPVKYCKTAVGMYHSIITTRSNNWSCLLIAQIAKGDELLIMMENIVRNTVTPDDPCVVVTTDVANNEGFSIQVSFAVILPIK